MKYSTFPLVSFSYFLDISFLVNYYSSDMFFFFPRWMNLFLGHINVISRSGYIIALSLVMLASVCNITDFLKIKKVNITLRSLMKMINQTKPNYAVLQDTYSYLEMVAETSGSQPFTQGTCWKVPALIFHSFWLKKNNK